MLPPRTLPGHLPILHMRRHILLKPHLVAITVIITAVARLWKLARSGGNRQIQIQLIKYSIHDSSNLIANSKHILACCPGGGLRARNMARTQRTPPIPNMGRDGWCETDVSTHSVLFVTESVIFLRFPYWMSYLVSNNVSMGFFDYCQFPHASKNPPLCPKWSLSLVH